MPSVTWHAGRGHGTRACAARTVAGCRREPVARGSAEAAGAATEVRHGATAAVVTAASVVAEVGGLAVAAVTVAAAVVVAAVVVAAAAAGTERERKAMRRIVTFAVVSGLVVFAVTGASAEESGGQTHFKSPTAAMQALVAAARAGDRTKMLAILGPEGEPLVESGDDVEDAAERRRFVTMASQRTQFETLSDGAVIAHLGRAATPLAIPLVKDGDAWRFDTAAGKDELLNRRIGRNELSAIAALRAYVEAQLQYARLDPGNVFAQKIRSEPGKRDGLYWENTSGTDESPLGPLFAEAAGEGYAVNEPSATPQPFHGYFFRILTAQGPNAPGGEQNYVKDGKMTGGFAMVAWPAEYGQSGVMTFLVNRQGVVFEKDLGAQTADTVKAMTTYDPDKTWLPTR
jgi:Protein of unknown function (DUF2950)